MRTLPFVLLGLAVLTASCESPRQLADGCYYARGKPVFQIAGTKGRVLIPGEVKTFSWERHGDAQVTFSPSLLFDGTGDGPSLVRAFPDAPPYSMKPGTSVPTIR